MDHAQAAAILAALPAELRQADLARALGVPRAHVGKMRSQNRVPKESYKAGLTPVWRIDDIRGWLTDRLVTQAADLESAHKAINATRAHLGHRGTRRALRPVWPFLGIE